MNKKRIHEIIEPYINDLLISIGIPYNKLNLVFFQEFRKTKDSFFYILCLGEGMFVKFEVSHKDVLKIMSYGAK